MFSAFLLTLLVLTPPQAASEISQTQKREFIQLLKSLPHKSEFFTDEAIQKAGPYLAVLFSLTEKDIEKYDIYPFLAVSRGLCDQEEHRSYATQHFAEIRHPLLKLFWAAMLFDSKVQSPEVLQFLRKALESSEQANLLSEITGPHFEDFKTRVLSVKN